MALLFRINAISKRLTGLCWSFTHPFLSPLSYPKRNLFTNGRRVYFAKKKADEAKIPSCPDFEQYFTKTKKGEGNKNVEEQSGKNSDDKLKPPIQPPIFGDKSKASPPQPRPISEKKISPTATLKKGNGGSYFPIKVPVKKSQDPSDKTKPLEKPQTFDKKYSITNPLSEFNQNTLMRRSSDTKNILNGSRSPQQMESDQPSSQSRTTGDDSKTEGKISEMKVSTTLENKNKKVSIWLAAAVAAVCALGVAALLMKQSNSDDQESQEKVTQNEAVNKGEKGDLEHHSVVKTEGEEAQHHPIIKSERKDAKHHPAVKTEKDDNQHNSIVKTDREETQHHLVVKSERKDAQHHPIIKNEREEAQHHPVVKTVSEDAQHRPVVKTEREDAKNHPIIKNERDFVQHNPLTVREDVHSHQVTKTKEKDFKSPSSIKTEMMEGRTDLVIPKKVPYLIIGGGTASWSAFRAIKEHVPNAKVIVVTNELDPPYMRPALMKNLTSSEANNSQDLYFEPTDFYTDPMQLLNDQNSKGGIAILSNCRAKYLKLCERKVVLSDGNEIEYDECLIAIGSQPRNLQLFQTAPSRVRKKIIFFRSLSDFHYIKEIADKSESIAVIGGGFLASQISLALTVYAAHTEKLKVYQIFHENGNMGMTLPRYFSDWITAKLTKHGLFVIPSTQVDSAGDAGGHSGNETDTSYDHALASGRLAGENMVGQKKSFMHQSMFSSVVAPEFAFQSVGLIDSKLKTIGVFSDGTNVTPEIENTNRGVVFYMKRDRVVGVLLWNVSNKINVARQVIAEGKKVYDINEVLKRFEIQN